MIDEALIERKIDIIMENLMDRGKPAAIPKLRMLWQGSGA